MGPGGMRGGGWAWGGAQVLGGAPTGMSVFTRSSEAVKLFRLPPVEDMGGGRWGERWGWGSSRGRFPRPPP